MRIHFWQRSNRRLEATANSSSAMVLMTPTEVLFRLSWDKVRPDSSSFTLWNQKKSAGVGSGKKEGCLSTLKALAASQLFTTAAPCTGALSQGKNQSRFTISGLFFLRCTNNLPRTTKMNLALMSAPLGMMWVYISPLLSKNTKIISFVG